MGVKNNNWGCMYIIMYAAIGFIVWCMLPWIIWLAIGYLIWNWILKDQVSDGGDTSEYTQLTEQYTNDRSMVYQSFNPISQFIRCSLYQSIEKLDNIYEQCIVHPKLQSLVQVELEQRYTSSFRINKFFYSIFVLLFNRANLGKRVIEVSSSIYRSVIGSKGSIAQCIRYLNLYLR